MILEKFYTNNFDSDIVLHHNGEDIDFLKLKKYVYFQKLQFDKKSELAVVLFGDNSFEFVVNFFAALFSNKEIYLLTDKTRLSGLNIDYIIPEKPDKNDEISFENIDVKKTKITFFTSGSTAIPKKITKTLENLEAEAYSSIKQFNIESNMSVYSTTIMSHMFGLTFFFMVPLCAGLKINTLKIEFPEQITKNEHYILVSSPSFLEKMEKYQIDFLHSPVKLFTAGDKLKDNVRAFFSNKSEVVEIYGSTEAGTIAYKNNSKNFKAFDSVSISTDENSCIIVKSDFFMEDKIKMEDVIEKVSDKEFVLKGRSDRIVKVKEKRISLVELETILKTHPDVNDCYCFKYGDVLAFAVATNNVELSDKELKKYLAKYCEVVPKKWRFLDEIPKTITGKIDKSFIEHIFNLNLSYPFVVSRQLQENEAELELIFKKKSNFFKGHFAVMPILPGVVQLFYANWFAKHVFNVDISKQEAKKVKFTNIIHADTKVVLKLKNTDKNVEYSYVIDDKVYSSGLFVKEDKNAV